jgi:hypothetical protein
LIVSCEALLDWGCRKLSSGEPFSVLILTHHPDGKRATQYCLDTVEEAIEQAVHEIRTGWEDLAGYVYCYDVTVSLKTSPERGFMFEAESSDSECRVILFHGTHQSHYGTWSAVGQLRLLNTGEKTIQSRLGDAMLMAG